MYQPFKYILSNKVNKIVIAHRIHLYLLVYTTALKFLLITVSSVFLI